jgi:hypothetical protein
MASLLATREGREGETEKSRFEVAVGRATKDRNIRMLPSVPIPPHNPTSVALVNVYEW